MAIFNMAGGGGSDLNFSVVGGTVWPGGKENLVWVNTSAVISGWVVSPNQPASPAEGLVWIQSGADNSINILKKNAVEIFPSGCKQFSGGSWQNVEAHLFRNGAWVQFAWSRYYIFKSGTGIEPGYRVNPAITSSGYQYSVSKIVWSTDNNYGNSLSISPSINLTNFTKLFFEFNLKSVITSDFYLQIGISNSSTVNWDTPGTFIASRSTQSIGKAVAEIDISRVNSNAFITLYGKGTTGEIYNIGLE